MMPISNHFPLNIYVIFVALIAWILALLVVLVIKSDKMTRQNKALLDKSEMLSELIASLTKHGGLQYLDLQPLRSDLREFASQVQEMLGTKLLEQLRADLREYAPTIQKNLDVQPTQNHLTGMSSTAAPVDHAQSLMNYLSLNYPSKKTEIMDLLESLAKDISNPDKIKERLLLIALHCGLTQMSETRRQEFLQMVNDYLARNGLSLYTPGVGHEFDESTMYKKKQFSQSSRVTSVVCFGLFNGDQLSIKADVNLG